MSRNSQNILSAVKKSTRPESRLDPNPCTNMCKFPVDSLSSPTDVFFSCCDDPRQGKCCDDKCVLTNFPKRPDWRSEEQRRTDIPSFQSSFDEANYTVGNTGDILDDFCNGVKIAYRAVEDDEEEVKMQLGSGTTCDKYRESNPAFYDCVCGTGPENGNCGRLSGDDWNTCLLNNSTKIKNCLSSKGLRDNICNYIQTNHPELYGCACVGGDGKFDCSKGNDWANCMLNNSAVIKNCYLGKQDPLRVKIPFCKQKSVKEQRSDPNQQIVAGLSKDFAECACGFCEEAQDFGTCALAKATDVINCLKSKNLSEEDFKASMKNFDEIFCTHRNDATPCRSCIICNYLNKVNTQLGDGLRGKNIPKVKPVEVKPVEVKPVEVKPVEVKPVEVKPVKVKPVEVKPVEVKPVEVKPKKEESEFPTIPTRKGVVHPIEKPVITSIKTENNNFSKMLFIVIFLLVLGGLLLFFSYHLNKKGGRR